MQLKRPQKTFNFTLTSGGDTGNHPRNQLRPDQDWPQGSRATHLPSSKANCTTPEAGGPAWLQRPTAPLWPPRALGMTSGIKPRHLGGQALSLVIPPTLRSSCSLPGRAQRLGTQSSPFSTAPVHRHRPGWTGESGPDQSPPHHHPRLPSALPPP